MLRSSFQGFEVGRMALRSSQLGLNTVGNNIANVETPGYTRQRIDQVSVSSTYVTKYAAYGYSFGGQGSNVTGVSQIRDVQLDKRYRTEASTAGEYASMSNDLLLINNIFDEMTTDGSLARMKDFLDALSRLIDDPSNTGLAGQLSSQALKLANTLNLNWTQLVSAEKQIVEELDQCAYDVNNILERIAMLNDKIKQANFYGDPANELNDERNLLIDQLSEYLPIDVHRTPYKVSNDVTIQLVSITITGTDIELVNGGTANGIKMKYDADGIATVHLTEGADNAEYPIFQNGSYSSDITKYLLTGGIKGHLNILNGKGTYAGTGDNTYRGIPYYKDVLDEYAWQLATMMNKLNELEVYDSNGNQLPNLKRDLFVNSGVDGRPIITAANITTSTEWNKDGMYLDAARKNNALYVEATVIGVDNSDPANPYNLYEYTIYIINEDKSLTEVKINEIDIRTTGPSELADFTFGDITFDSQGNIVLGYDTDGKPIYYTWNDDATPPTPKWGFSDVTDNAVNLGNLQRAITEEIPFNMGNYITADGELLLIDDTTGQLVKLSFADFISNVTYVDKYGSAIPSPSPNPPPTSFSQLQIDNGDLYYEDGSGVRCYFNVGASSGVVLPSGALSFESLVNKVVLSNPAYFSDSDGFLNIPSGTTISATDTTAVQHTSPPILHIPIWGSDGSLQGYNEVKLTDSNTTIDKNGNILYGEYQVGFNAAGAMILVDKNTTAGVVGYLNVYDHLEIDYDPGKPSYSVGDPTPTHLLPGAAADDRLIELKQNLEGNTSFGQAGFTGSYQKYLEFMMKNMATDKEVNDTNLSSTYTVLSGLADTRDAVSAVNIDEEAVNMMVFQNYYNAASRYITVLDEALGTIIQSMGVVGR